MSRHLCRLAAGAFLLAACVGCTSSGRATFVKITPDSRWVILEDQCYAQVYWFDVRAGVRHAFPGPARCACMSREPIRLVLQRWQGSAEELKCVLVRFEENGPVCMDLPAQRLPFYDFCPVIEFGPGPNRIQVVACNGPGAHAAMVSFVLTIGDAQWQPAEVPQRLREYDLWRSWQRPVGVREGGHAYHFDGRHSWGVDIEEETGGKHGWLLRSPNGRFMVRIDSVADFFPRIVLTDLESRREHVLLQRDDLSSDIWRGAVIVLALPISPFLPRI
jgi:hypothetical protein